MAILAEWYTIHKSSDATYAILTALEDMGRTDCTEIIEEALKEAGIVVVEIIHDEWLLNMICRNSYKHHYILS